MKVPLGIKFPFSGTLALAGSGEYLPPMESVDRLLLMRLKESAKVVCLPTAAGTEGKNRLNYWMNLGEEHFRRLGVASVESLPVFNRKNVEDPDLVRKVADANFVYLSGGKPYYLMDCLTNSRMADALMQILKTGGVVAGCSAGAMIFGERIPDRSFIGGTKPGLALLSGFFIVPHFDEMPFIFKYAIPHMVGNQGLLGIEANTVLICSQDEFFVAGSGGVTVATETSKERYLAD